MRPNSGSLFVKIVTIELARIIPIITTAALGKRKNVINDLVKDSLHPKDRAVIRRRVWGVLVF
jgi:hypothetical protein